MLFLTVRQSLFVQCQHPVKEVRSMTHCDAMGLRHVAIRSLKIGGAEGDRTPDLMTASHALSQLSYGPLRSE